MYLFKYLSNKTYTIKNEISFLLFNNYKFYQNNNICNYLNIKRHFCSEKNDMLKEALELQNQMTNNSIIDNKVKCLCSYYQNLKTEHKNCFLINMSTNYSSDFEAVRNAARTVANENMTETKFIAMKDKLQSNLLPRYHWLFIHVGRQEKGVKFLVDMRTDLLELIKQMNMQQAETIHLQQLNKELKNLLLLWFSVGFLKLERITWKSSCEMLEKIANYEAVHPVRSWTDLKHRVGSDRRCFVYTHSSMPDEPLVVLHTALRPDIVNSLTGLTANQVNNKNMIEPECVTPKAAIFYSISATQEGLQGVELGNYIIKRVAKILVKEFPNLDKFSTLSPIPRFKIWLFDKFKQAEDNPNILQHIFTQNDLQKLKELLQTENVYGELRKQMNLNTWLQIPNLPDILEPLMKKMCIWYLYLEKKRGYTLCSVANFHLRNGAEMWRINWMSDVSARGLKQSCGMMVNYRYYLDETDKNSQNYIQNRVVTISTQVQKLINTVQ